MVLLDLQKRIYMRWQSVCGGLVASSVAAFATPLKRGEYGKAKESD